MKPNHHTTEELLEKGKGISLSQTEHAEIKASLLSYASYHGAKDTTPNPKPAWSLWWVRGVTASTLALFLMISTGYAATDSLPGEPLYGVKVNVMEELVALGQFTEQAQLQYHQKRYEARLLEVHQLAAADELTLETVAIIKEEIGQLHTDVEETLAHDTDSSINQSAVLAVTSDIVSITKAISGVVETEISEVAAERIEDEVDAAAELHAEEMQDLLEAAATSTVELYIESQLKDISAELKAGTVSASTTIQVAEFIEDIDSAVASSNLDIAATLASEAAQHINTEEYTEDYENEMEE